MTKLNKLWSCDKNPHSLKVDTEKVSSFHGLEKHKENATWRSLEKWAEDDISSRGPHRETSISWAEVLEAANLIQKTTVSVCLSPSLLWKKMRIL
jgi:hypothetical protein